MASDFELEVLQQLSEIKKTGAAQEAGLTALNDRLFQNPTGLISLIHEDVKMLKDADLGARIKAMEEDLKDHKKWQNIKLITAAVVQALGAIIGIHYRGPHA